jgi:FtsZ-binding cell division protein ZapB
LKRLLSYERTSNEGLRKAFFELRGSLEGEINNARREQFQMEQEVGNLRNEKKMVDKENAKLKREVQSCKERLEATLLKLDDADIRLRANVSADTDISKLRVRSNSVLALSCLFLIVNFSLNRTWSPWRRSWRMKKR